MLYLFPVLISGFVAVEFGWGKFQKDNKPGALCISLGSVSVSELKCCFSEYLFSSMGSCFHGIPSVFNN